MNLLLYRVYTYCQDRRRPKIKSVTERPTDGRTDGHVEQTHPLIESLRRDEKYKDENVVLGRSIDHSVMFIVAAYFLDLP